MTTFYRVYRRVLIFSILLLFALICRSWSEPFERVLDRAQSRTKRLTDLFSDVKCLEHVTQEKFGKNDHIELKEESSYDYLAIFTEAAGELTLNESRLAVVGAKESKLKNRPLLVSNGFATLFLIFHPYYANSFQFFDEGLDSGEQLEKVHFQHIPGTRSPLALAVRGREYALELTGTAWVNPQTGDIVHISSSVGESVSDIGLNALQAEVRYVPAPFLDGPDRLYLPSQATVEVESPRQHWRNTHTFADYKRFSVTTEEKVTQNP
jgi:hypothetical protein